MERRIITNDATDRSVLLKPHNIAKICKKPSVYKPVLILIVLFLFQQLSCGYVIVFYAVDLFKQIGGDLHSSLNSYVALVFLGTVRFLMSLLSTISSKRIGRRPTMLFSVSGMCISIFAAGYFFNSEANISNNAVSYLIVVYICFSSIGYFVIPWTLIGEILPIKFRGKLGGAMISIAYIFMFCVVKSFPFILDTIQLKHVFYGLSLINLCSLFPIFYMLPETLGKTFSEIEKYFTDQ